MRSSRARRRRKGSRWEEGYEDKLGKHHGQECLLDYGHGDDETLLLVYVVGSRLYLLSSDWSPNRGQNSADAEKFMNSFKVTD